MDFLLADASFVNDNLLKTLAWVFTLISGVASITLTIHKFGLPKWKQITLICSTLAFGLAVVFFIIPKVSPFEGPAILTAQETQQLQMLATHMGDSSGGYERTADGIVTKAIDGPVKSVTRVSEHVYAVLHSGGQFDAVYSGDFFDATVDGKTISCELIDLGNDRVLIVKGDDTEFIDLNSDQSKSDFKIKKVTVKGSKTV